MAYVKNNVIAGLEFGSWEALDAHLQCCNRSGAGPVVLGGAGTAQTSDPGRFVAPNWPVPWPSMPWRSEKWRHDPNLRSRSKTVPTEEREAMLTPLRLPAICDRLGPARGSGAAGVEPQRGPCLDAHSCGLARIGWAWRWCCGWRGSRHCASLRRSIPRPSPRSEPGQIRELATWR